MMTIQEVDEQKLCQQFVVVISWMCCSMTSLVMETRR